MHWLRAFLLFTWSAALLGCSTSQPVAEQATPAAKTRWLVQCESSLKPRLEPGEDTKSAAPKGWINARTPNDAKIFVLGKLDDGFVQATAAIS